MSSFGWRSVQVAYSSWDLLSTGMWVVLWSQRFSLIRVRIAGDKERFIRFGNQSCRQWEWPISTRKGSLSSVVSPRWENSLAPHKPHSLPASNAEFSTGSGAGSFPAHEQLLNQTLSIACHKEGQKLFWLRHFSGQILASISHGFRKA